MTKPPKTRTPSDHDVWEESSSVLPKPSSRRQSGEYRLATNPSIDQLVRMGQELLARLPSDHPRGRMLRLAVLRHDEVLLTGLVAELSAEEDDALPDTVPPPRNRT
jgi:hypothetical protein